MDLHEFSEKFSQLPAKEKIKFLDEKLLLLKEGEKIKFLLSVLKDTNLSSLVRVNALKHLSHSSHQNIETYQNYTNDPSFSVAKAARKILTQLKQKDPKSRNLAQLVMRKIRSSQDRQKRLKILKSITQVKDPWVNEVLLESLEDPSEAVRDFIIDELGSREHLNINMVYQKLLKPPWYVKSAILKILAFRKNPHSLGLIETTVNDSNAEVRRNAAQALGEIGGDEALVLLNKLAKDRNRFVRKSAEEALRKASHLKFS